jgi:nucleoside-diphosphate-sugar epimerase
LALEKAKPGTRLHAAAESGIPMREIAEAVGEGLGLPARSITSEEAPAHFGFFAFFTATDNPTSSAITRETMGWVPTGPGLLEGLRSGAYMS